MTPDQMHQLADRLRDHAGVIYGLWKDDLNAAADLIEQLRDLKPTAWYDPRWPDRLDNDDAFADFPIWEWVPLYVLPIDAPPYEPQH